MSEGVGSHAQVIRCINIAVLWPVLARTGDGITLTSALLTAWSGLRGIVGLALALYVLLDARIENAAYRTQAFFFMSTTLVLTVVVQGSLYGPLLMVCLPFHLFLSMLQCSVIISCWGSTLDFIGQYSYCGSHWALPQVQAMRTIYWKVVLQRENVVQRSVLR